MKVETHGATRAARNIRRCVLEADDRMRDDGGATEFDRGWRKVASPSVADLLSISAFTKVELLKKYAEMRRLAGGSL
jgi:hypothetical protein